MRIEGRKERTETRCKTILDAARYVFAHSGFAQTNVDDIAARAGVAKGTLYLYFASKEQIYMAALLEDARQLDVLTRDRIAAAPSWEEKIRAYVEVRLEYMESHQEFVRIYLAEIRSAMLRGAPICPQYLETLRESETQLTQVIAAAVATRQIRKIDPELTALTIVELTRGLLERRLLGAPRHGSCDLEFLLDLLRNALTPTTRKANPHRSR
jgi:AcrR family transcriptional regulator